MGTARSQRVLRNAINGFCNAAQAIKNNKMSTVIKETAQIKYFSSLHNEKRIKAPIPPKRSIQRFFSIATIL